MELQNYSSHKRYVPAYHFLTSGLIIAVLVIAVMQMVKVMGGSDTMYSGIMPVLIAVVLILMFWYARSFATKVQDRTIRAEENLRHYVMTGKMLDPRLTMSQIVALRFAPDEEYLELIEQAIKENMKADDIKKTIKNWKADHHRA